MALVSCLVYLAASSTVLADDYADARAELIAAYQQADYAEMRVAARKAIAARPGYPGALFNLALAQALDEDPTAAMQTLRDLLSVGVDFGVAGLDEFAALKNLLEWRDYESAVQRLYEPLGFAEVFATLDVADFIPEGIAADAQGRIYLGSIRNGDLVRLGDNPEVLSSAAAGHWSVFGMRFDRGGGLWFASAAVPQFANAAADAGRSGLFRLAPDDHEISHAALLPAAENAQVLGDLIVADDDTLYTTDSLTGVVYRYNITKRAFETLVEQGVFGSPQGLVLDRTQQYLYVADYVGGLFRVKLEDGKVEKVKIQANVTDYGIDGLYRYNDELIVIQNGVRPNRVVALTLAADGLAVSRSRTLAANLTEFDEPTLGFVAGDDFYFVANSHWNRFDQQNQLPDGLSGPIVLRLSLRRQ